MRIERISSIVTNAATGFVLSAVAFATAFSGSPLFAQQDTENKELEEETVLGDAESEQTLVGPYNQPEWTARPHRFATTRHYVLPPGVTEFEFWTIGVFEEGVEPEYEVQEELLIGLPNRFQLDFYQVQAQGVDEDSFHHAESKAEVRWALDEWGEIPLNPTLYAEWEKAADDDADAVEYKLLLADDLAPGWYWAGNLVYEQSYSNDRETELAATSGLNYTLEDKKLNVGLEAEVERATAEGSRGDPEWEGKVGPSFQYRFTDSARVRLVPLAGVGNEAPDIEAILVFGITLSGEDGYRSETITAERK